MEEERSIRMYELAHGPWDHMLTLPEGYEIVGAQWNVEKKALLFFIEGPKHPVVLGPERIQLRTISVDDLLSGRWECDRELETLGYDEPNE